MMSASLLIDNGAVATHCLNAYIQVIELITGNDDISNSSLDEVTEELLMGEPFTMTYNSNKTIKSVHR